MDRVPTGCDPLDAAVGGGIPQGYTVLIEGPHGLGSTELALTILRAVARQQGSPRASFVSALRSRARVHAEVARLFGQPTERMGISVVEAAEQRALPAALEALSGFRAGDALVVESLQALAPAPEDGSLVGAVRQLGDVAQRVGAVVIVLHSPGAVGHLAEARVAEQVDGLFSVSVRDAGSTRRRMLALSKMRGLSPALEGDQMPVFEVTLRTGVGFAISAVKSVV